VVISTGKGAREVDMEAMRQGAADYIEKSSLTPDTFERCIRYNMERSRVLNELRNARQRLRALSGKLVDAQERERRLIAQELHDSIGSGMTAIKFALESKIESMDKDHPPSRGISVEKILSMVQETLEETRRISAKLRPAILDDLGLVLTIRWVCRNFQGLHPRIRIRQAVEIQESDVPESLKTVVYRILQEALNNVAKHSSADAVDLFLRKKDGALELQVQDNGTGFDKKAVFSEVRPTGGMGLEGMQDRVEFADGTIDIDSRIGEGTTVRVTLPIFPPNPFR
jgi:signal transduction histidine kinase